MGVKKQADHGIPPCPECGGNIVSNPDPKRYYHPDAFPPYACEGCRRTFTDSEIQNHMPSIPCPKCGSKMGWRDGSSLGGLYPEGAWECSNQRCWNMVPPDQVFEGIENELPVNEPWKPEGWDLKYEGSWRPDGTTDTLAILSAVIESPLPSLPPRSQRLGATRVLWWEANPGEAVIMATGGTVDDRAYAEQLVKIQLGPHSYRRVGFTIDAAQKTGQWADIMAKAKRLIQSNQVTVLRNGYNNIVGHVIGDHGEYNVEIGRDDPNSQAITTWQCECPWDQFAFQRTRKWKKYEARPCAHVLALYWKAKSTPLDEDATQEQQQALGPGQRGPAPAGPGKVPGVQPQAPAPGAPPGLPRSFGPEGEPIQGDQSTLPGMPDATGGPPAPAQAPLAPPGAPDIFPPFPGDQMSLMEQWKGPGTTPGGQPSPPGAVSVPGAKPPTPFNPIQSPGGTYSKTAATEEVWSRSLANGDATASYYLDPGTLTIAEFSSHQPGGGTAALQQLRTEFSDRRIAVLDVSMAEGFWRKMKERGLVDDLLRDDGSVMSRVAAEFNPPEIVRLKNDCYGVAEGTSELHGAGSYRNVPAGSTGEVLSQDESSRWVEVIFPLDESGELEPYHVRCFIEPQDLDHSRVRPPGPFIQRKR